MGKRTYVRSITESRAVNLFTKKYGTDFMSRWKKLEEEFNELKIVVEDIDDRGRNNLDMNNIYNHLDDELSDLQACLTHFASLRDLYQQEMLDMAIDKIKGRETDPNYKRF